MRAKPILLFITMGFAGFVRSDAESLAAAYRMRIFQYRPSRTLAGNARQMVRLLVWLVRHAPRASAILVWFADYHAALPVLASRALGKPSALVLAGYDTVFFPQWRYGVFSNPIRSAFAAFAIRHAGTLAPVSIALTDRLRRRIPDPRGRITAIPFGFDPSRWYCDTPKADAVVSVSIAFDQTRVAIKGVDVLVEAARRLPGVPFTVVGVPEAMRAELDAPPNVILAGRLPPSDMRRLCSRAKVVAQLSRSEGMPNALCEAMLCECVPVGSDAGGIPEVIGDAGSVVRAGDAKAAAAAIRKALFLPRRAGREARRRIVERFPASLRRARLLALFPAPGGGRG
jgi:glycosyltransferase involved in cell wall biosynthesis